MGSPSPPPEAFEKCSDHVLESSICFPNLKCVPFQQLREETYKLAGENRLLKSEVLLAEEYFKKATEERDELYSTFVATLNQIHSRSSYKSAQVWRQHRATNILSVIS